MIVLAILGSIFVGWLLWHLRKFRLRLRMLTQAEAQRELELRARKELESVCNLYSEKMQRVSMLHLALFKQYLAASLSEDADAANEHWRAAKGLFDEIRDIVVQKEDGDISVQSLDVGMLRATIKNVQADADKWRYIQGINESTLLHRMPSDGGCLANACPFQVFDGKRFSPLRSGDKRVAQIENGCIEFNINCAHWVKHYFFDKFAELVEVINSAQSVSDIAATYRSVSVQKFPGELHDGRYKLLFDPSADINGCLVHMKKGPIKEAESCRRKATAMHSWEECAEAEIQIPMACNIRDFLRLTLSAADPMVIAVIVEALLDIPSVRLRKIKNKYLGELSAILKTGSPSILMNLEVVLPDTPIAPIVEVQIYLDSVLSLKKLAHKTYEFVRCFDDNDFEALLRPIYKPKYDIVWAHGAEDADIDESALAERKEYGASRSVECRQGSLIGKGSVAQLCGELMRESSISENKIHVVSGQPHTSSLLECSIPFAGADKRKLLERKLSEHE